MSPERYWQIAWSEYKKRRCLLESKYKSSPGEAEQWQKIGRKLYISFIDPQLFIEGLFTHRQMDNSFIPPTIAEVNGSISTIGMWFSNLSEAFRPDAEGVFWEAGNKLNSLVSRYPDSKADYWFEKHP